MYRAIKTRSKREIVYNYYSILDENTVIKIGTDYSRGPFEDIDIKLDSKPKSYTYTRKHKDLIIIQNPKLKVYADKYIKLAK